MSLTPDEPPTTVIVNNVSPTSALPPSVHETLTEQIQYVDQLARGARQRQERWQGDADAARGQAERAEARLAELRNYLALHTQPESTPEPTGYSGPSGSDFVQ